MATPLLVISMEGGLVTAVCTDQPERLKDFRVVVVDYDTDDADPKDLNDVIQADGSVSEAYIGNWGPPEELTIDADDLRKQTDPV